MSLPALILLVLVVTLIGLIPAWGYNRIWGYIPGGVVGIILVLLIVLALIGRF